MKYQSIKKMLLRQALLNVNLAIEFVQFAVRFDKINGGNHFKIYSALFAGINDRGNSTFRLEEG